MAQEATTIARPYAEAVYKRALETGSLDGWSDMLGLLAKLVEDPGLAGLLANPKLERARKAELLLDIGGEHLDADGRNLVQLLVENGRVGVVSQIATLFERMKSEHEGTVDVHVISAFPVEADAEQALAKALRKKLGREIRVSSEQDPELIGGVLIRAGDLVIDGSVSGQLSQLAHELNV